MSAEASVAKVDGVASSRNCPFDFVPLGPNPSACTVPTSQGILSLHGSLAQLVEQLTLNQRVAGSSPARSTKISGSKPAQFWRVFPFSDWPAGATVAQ